MFIFTTEGSLINHCLSQFQFLRDRILSWRQFYGFFTPYRSHFFMKYSHTLQAKPPRLISARHPFLLKCDCCLAIIAKRLPLIRLHVQAMKTTEEHGRSSTLNQRQIRSFKSGFVGYPSSNTLSCLAFTTFALLLCQSQIQFHTFEHYPQYVHYTSRLLELLCEARLQMCHTWTRKITSRLAFSKWTVLSRLKIIYWKSIFFSNHWLHLRCNPANLKSIQVTWSKGVIQQ